MISKLKYDFAMFKWNFKCGTCIVSSVIPSSIHGLNKVFFCTMLVNTNKDGLKILCHTVV